jgi:hypothetical protein
MLNAFIFPPYDGHGHAGFHHLSAHPASLLNTGQGPGLQSNTSGGFQQRISIISPEASGSGSLRCLSRQDATIGAHAHLTACTRVLNHLSHHHLT